MVAVHSAADTSSCAQLQKWYAAAANLTYALLCSAIPCRSGLLCGPAFPFNHQEFIDIIKTCWAINEL